MHTEIEESALKRQYLQHRLAEMDLLARCCSGICQRIAGHVGIAKEPPVKIDLKIILVIGAIGVVLAVSAPGAAAARCEPCDGIVAVKAGGKQDAVGGFLRAGLDQQVDV